ncbi:unnamed protein product [Brachionus calyciflorus]|uniref:Uncharacterized protein n=1 Tax=Brachionus calyciflorus TaxID=104777 RepID=A0A813RXE9_9BILA|nr:unnamed protein product [Brachionus calyciflorus]
MNLSAQTNRVHYLIRANPFKTIDSIADFIDKNLYLTSNKDIALLNKPPGFVLSDKSKDTKYFIPVVKETIKQKLKWSNALRLPFLTDDQAGIFMFVSNKNTFDLVKKTMKVTFPSQHIPFLKFYGITTFIPGVKKDSQVIHVKYENIHNDLLNFEVLNPSKNEFKTNKVLSYQIEHEIVDVNKDLNVALVRFNTSWHYGDGILYYSIKNLFPILGDHRYSPRVKTILGKPVLVAKQREFKPSTQVLSQNILNCLQINDYLRDVVPLHLQLYQINMEKKFKKQSIVLKQQVPLQDYFKQTLKNLCLNIPNEDELEKIN